jgi:hypothetical protein
VDLEVLSPESSRLLVDLGGLVQLLSLEVILGLQILPSLSDVLDEQGLLL